MRVLDVLDCFRLELRNFFVNHNYEHRVEGISNYGV